MAYLVLARKYRPQTFEEVVGQEHITRTLKNALDSKRVAHAYLLSGQRGTGKTSVARILAKSLNCEEGATGTPCNKCDFCREIMEGNSPDVVEIDGASNTGIDNIRDLIEKSRFLPVKNRVKVYIIDEVHRISKQAFDALLKTLEEPSDHVYFIFATTEIASVPATIASRCQKFTFRKLTVQEIAAHLAKILKLEKIEIETRILGLIARNSDGALRDAESILDQIISFTGGKVKFEEVEELLESVNQNQLFKFTAALLEGRADEALNMIDELAKTGTDEFLFTKNLAVHFRNLLIIKVAKKPEDLMDMLDADDIEKLKEQAGLATKTKLVNSIRVITQLLESLKQSSYKRVLLEVAAIKLAGLDEMLDINDLLKRIDGAGGMPAEEKKTLKTETPVIPQKKIQPQMAEKQAQAPEQTSSASFNDIEEVEALSGADESANLVVIRKNWPLLVETVREKKKTAAGVLSGAVPSGYSGGVLRIAVKDDYSKSSLESETCQTPIKEAFKSIFKKQISLVIVKDIATKEGKTAAPAVRPEGGKEKAVDPIVDAANKLFGGRIMRKDEHGKL